MKCTYCHCREITFIAVGFQMQKNEKILLPSRKQSALPKYNRDKIKYQLNVNICSISFLLECIPVHILVLWCKLFMWVNPILLLVLINCLLYGREEKYSFSFCFYCFLIIPLPSLVSSSWATHPAPWLSQCYAEHWRTSFRISLKLRLRWDKALNCLSSNTLLFNLYLLCVVCYT